MTDFSGTALHNIYYYITKKYLLTHLDSHINLSAAIF